MSSFKLIVVDKKRRTTVYEPTISVTKNYTFSFLGMDNQLQEWVGFMQDADNPWKVAVDFKEKKTEGYTKMSCSAFRLKKGNKVPNTTGSFKSLGKALGISPSLVPFRAVMKRMPEEINRWIFEIPGKPE